MKETIEICPSPPFRGEVRGLGELALEVPHLTPTLSAPRGGEGQLGDLHIAWRLRSSPASRFGDPPGRPNPMPSASS